MDTHDIVAIIFIRKIKKNNNIKIKRRSRNKKIKIKQEIINYVFEI